MAGMELLTEKLFGDRNERKTDSPYLGVEPVFVCFDFCSWTALPGCLNGGEDGIRTHETFKGLHAFQECMSTNELLD